MWHLRRHCLIALLLASAGLCRAQDGIVVLVDTNLPDATVYADSLRLGPASRGAFVIGASTRMLRLVPAGDDVWSIQPVTVALSAQPGDTLELHLPFPYHYKIESIPFGATVLLETLGERRAVGETPVLYTSVQRPDGAFVVEQPGYVTERLTPGHDVWNRYVLTMQPVEPLETATAQINWRPPPRRRRWIDYSAAAAALTAGALSVHYKFKADRLDDRYRETGDPDLRPRIRSLDTRAVVALGAMQAGVGVLALRFVLK